MIFIFYNLDSGYCCTKGTQKIQVLVEYVDLELGQNTLYDYHSDIFGYYNLQNQKINGKDHFISLSNDGKNAIWATNGSWAIGLTENLGSVQYDAYVISEENCPYDDRFIKVPLTEGKWRYSLSDGWFNAGEGLVVTGRIGGYRC